MGYEFKPSIWFVCRFCRQAFRYLYKLKEHKVECHLGECLKTKCLIFEERVLDHEWIPSTEELPSNDRPFSSIAGNSNPRNSYKNPFVSLQKLTPQQLNVSPKKIPSASESIPREIEDRRRTGIKRTADKLLVSLSAPVEYEHCTEKKCNIDDGKHAEITTPIAVPQIVFDSEVHKIELNVEELQQLTENTVVSSSTSNLVCESNPVGTVCEDAQEIEIENREFIVASIVQNSDGTGNVHFMSTHVPEIGLLNQRNTFPTILDDAESELNSANGISEIEVQEEINSDEVDVENESNDAFFDEDRTIPLPFPAEEDHAESLPINFGDAVSTTDRLFDHSSASNNQHSPEQSELTPIPDPRCNSDSTGTCIEIETSLEPSLASPVPLPLEPELPTSIRSRYNTRRKASKVNYSEIQPCKGCAKDFYTVEDVEDHEKLCQLLRIKTKENEQAKETVDEEIQVIGSITKKTCTNEIASDDEDRYKSPNSESDTENDDVDYVIDRRPRSQGHSQVNQIIPTVTLSAEDLSLPLLDWITKEKSSNPYNVILLDPGPTSETLPVAVSDLHPMKCVLCKLVLTSDTQAKEHVKVCWTFNKEKHLYCVPCKKAFCSPYSLKRHCKRCHVPSNLITNRVIMETVDGTEAEAPAINSNAAITQMGSQINSDSISDPNVPEANLAESGSRHSTRRKKPKLNYSETQTCRGCAKDFDTFEAVKDHEQMCSQLRSKNTENKATKSKQTENDEIEILGSTAENILANEVADDDDNYECPDSSGSSSDLESASCVTDPQPSTHYRRRRSGAVLTRLTSEDHSLPLVDWIKIEKVSDPSNVILLDPDPTSETVVIEVTSLKPVKCVLCKLKLTSDTQVKEHVRVCWDFNKSKHLYCIACKSSFSNRSCFVQHIHTVHKKLYTRNLKVCRRKTGTQNSLPPKDLECKEKLKSAQCASKETVDDGNSDNQECPGKRETGSDSESGNCVIGSRPRSQGHPTLSRLSLNTPIITKNYIPLKEWLPLQTAEPAHSYRSRNVIRIDPDPTVGDLDPPNIVIDKDHPVTCLLCSLLLFSEVHLKNHIENCWFHNKEKHRYCVLCEFRFQSPSLLRIHQQFDHFDYNSETRFSTDARTAGSVTAGSASEMLQEPAQPVLEDESDAEVISISDEISLVDWLNERKGRASKNKILLDPDPTEAKTPIKISKKSPILCKLCDRKLVSEYSVKVHLQKCWRHNKKAHVFCVPCNMQFGSSAILAVHNRLHHGLGEGREFPFYCKYCSTGFKDAKALRIHRLSYIESKKVITSGVYNFEQDPTLHDPVIRNGPMGQPVGKSFAENRKIRTDLSLIEWLTQQGKANPSNCIQLDPDPLCVTPTFEGVSDAHPVTCKLCSRKFTAEALLRHHVQICWLRNKRIHRHCVHCNKTYRHPKMLIRHNGRRHPTGPRKTFKCKVCAKEYKTLEIYKAHEKFHVDPDKAKPFKCEICEHSFRVKFQLETHILSHSSERTFKCPHCPMTFIRKLALTQHLAVHTLGKEDPNDTSKPTGTHLNCKFCDRFFTSKNNLKAHERTHTGDRPFKCKVVNCDRAFPSQCALLMHTKIKHSEELGLTQFLCQSCGKKFPLQSHLDYHTRRFHTEAKDKPFKCTNEGCNRTFSMKEQLNQHTLVHTGEKPFQCDQCGRAFAGKQSFKKHQLTHNDKGEGNEILCHLCPQTFSTDRGLQRHLKLGHEKGSKFKCQFCERMFATNSGLTKHEETHEEYTDSDSASCSE